MRKDAYRMIFEGAFDNAICCAIDLNNCAKLYNDKALVGATQHVLLYRMLIMAYEMDIVTYEEKEYLRNALKAIFVD